MSSESTGNNNEKTWGCHQWNKVSEKEKGSGGFLYKG